MIFIFDCVILQTSHKLENRNRVKLLNKCVWKSKTASTRLPFSVAIKFLSYSFLKYSICNDLCLAESKLN